MPILKKKNLGCNGKFFFLNVNNTQKLIFQLRNQIIFDNNQGFKIKQDLNKKITRYKIQ